MPEVLLVRAQKQMVVFSTRFSFSLQHIQQKRTQNELTLNFSPYHYFT